MLTDFTQLEAWKKAMDLAVAIHAATKQFPSEEKFGIISQMRRASLSVAANIAEGFGRHTAADKKHKYIQARGELIELMTFLHYCKKVQYLSSEEDFLAFLGKCTVVHKLINGLITSMKQLQQ